MKNRLNNSLRGLLLKRLVPVMLTLVVAGALTAYLIAFDSATRAYDRSLWDTAFSVAQQIHLDTKGKPHLFVSQEAENILRTDKFDHVLFGVYTRDGQWVGGERHLPLPSSEEYRQMVQEGRLYYDGQREGLPLRIAGFVVERGDQALTVLAAETLVKRNLLVREILLGMVLPELALIVITMLLVWSGVRAGLQPLETLHDELTARSPADLSPVQASVPEEVQPVKQAINELLQRLSHALDAQRHLVSDAAHQLRTPIAALQAQLEIALRKLDPIAQQQLEGTAIAAYRISHLVKQLLSLSRAEPDQQTRFETADLAEIIQKSAETCFTKAIAKGIDLGFELRPTLLLCHPFLLQEAVTNLLDNAICQTPAGGVVNVACDYLESSDDNTARTAWISVEDSGPGIPDRERSRIFERFYQSPGQNEGCGLGLAIVREVVRQHSGHVDVAASKTLKGAAFTLRFPVKTRG